MPIDTQNKRRSTLGLWSGPRVLPVPSSGIDAEDRLHVWLYRIAGGAGALVNVVRTMMMMGLGR